MAASVHDQSHLAGLFDAGEVARLFSASAEIRAMLVVEGTLAKAQGAAGTIPELSANAIHRASLEIQLDPGALAAETALNGVSVPALVSQFRTLMQAPEHAQFIHWGATSQDIIDTSLMLRLRQAITLIQKDISTCLSALADHAERHADTPMAARTFGQHAAPTSFGAVVASWGRPLLSAMAEVEALDFPVSLAGAVGTASVLGEDPAALRKAVADGLKLTDPERGWHTDRTPIHKISNALTNTATALGLLGENLLALVQSDVGELRLGAAGSSSTMPHKQNPVVPSVLVALANFLQGLESTLKGAAIHRFQRDGTAWFTEWMVLPQIVMGAATMARHATRLIRDIEPLPDQMRAVLEKDGLLFAETLTFALAQNMPRPEAAQAVKDLAREVRVSRTPLLVIAQQKWPDLPPQTFDIASALGRAPQEARAFVKAVRG